MSYFKEVSVLLVITLLPAMAYTDCQKSNIEATTPTNRFTINNDGTVIDTKTGLMWKKCSEGQNGVNCDNNAITYTWQAALQQVLSVNNNGGFAGYNDWRLPNIKELYSIIEEQCIVPAINLDVFPNTPSNRNYWSSSPHNANDSSNAWFVGFGYGYYGYADNISSRNANLGVRLVR